MGDKLSQASIDEQRYRVLIDNAPEMVLILDAATGRFIDANPAAIKLLKFSRAEILQSGPSDISPLLYQGRSAAEKAKDYIDQALRGSNPVFDWVHIDRDGEEIPCEIRLIRFPPYDRPIVRASIIDLRKEKQIEAALEASEERLQLALRATGLGCYDWYPQENKLLWDTGMHDLFGLDAAAELDRGDFYRQAIHEDDRERVYSHLEAVLSPTSNEQVFTDQYRITKSGKTIYLQSMAVVVRARNGEVQRLIGTVQDITARTEANEQLQHQATLLDKISDAVVETDAEFRVRSWNKAAEKLYGWTAAEAIGQSLVKLVPVQYLAESREEVRAYFMREGYWSGEVIQQNKEGEELYVLSSVTALRDEAGKLMGSLGVNRDVSDRRQAELALQESEARYRSLVQHFPNGLISLFDRDLRYTLVDGEGIELLDFDPADFIGKRLQDFFPPETYERHEAAQRAALRGEKSTIVISVGTKRYSVTTLPVRDEGGNIIAGLEVSQDISTLAEAERQLNKTLEQLQLTIKTAGLGTWQYSFATDTIEGNHRLLEMYGLNPAKQELTREIWRDRIHPEDKDAVLEKMAQLFAGKPLPKTEFRILHPNGEVRHIQGAGSPIFDQQGKHIEHIGVNIDITSIKKNADALRESEAFLRAIYDSSLNAVLVADDEGHFQSFNQAASEMLAYPEAELRRLKLPDLPIANIPDRTAWYQKVIKKGRDIGELVLSLPNDQVRTVHYYVVQIKPNFNLCVFVDITERKQAEVKLQESEEKFSKSFHANPTGMMLVDLQQRTILDVNKAYTALSGYQPEEVVHIPGKLGFRTRASADGNSLEAAFRLIQEHDRLANFEVQIISKTGTVKSVLAFAEPLDIQNRHLHILTTVNISERKRVEEALLEAKEYAENLIETANVMVISLDQAGKVRIFNKAAQEITGYSQEELAGKSWFETLVPRDRYPQVWEAFQQIAKHGKSLRTFENPILTKTGEERIISWQNSTLYHQGEISGTISFGMDITQRKRTEKALKDRDKRFDVSTRAAQLGIWDWNIGQDILIWDDTMLRIYGSGGTTHTGRMSEWQRYLHPEDLPLFRAMIEWRSPDEEEFTTEFRIYRRDGALRYIKAVASLQRDETGAVIGMIGANWDITQEKEAEKARIRARQLELRNRELEQFAYVASHDLQEPLRTVISFVGLLKRKYQDKLDERAHDYMQFVVEASSRMSELIKGLLEYSRIGSNRQLSVVDTAVLVQQILDDLAAQINVTQAVVEVLPLPQIKGYETELRLLFQNLISNAIKFREPEQQPTIRIAVAEERSQWVFSVQDEGIGIDPIFQDQIFVLFQRLHGREEYEGTGIGLAHCRKITELHGGTIWVESEVGKGSTFFFSIAKSEDALD